MQVTVTTQITISATPAEVFKYLKDLNYHYLWNPQVQEISPITTLKKGATYQTSSLVLGVKIRAQNEVTEFIADKQIDLENKTGLVKYHASFKLVPKGKRTQASCATTVSSDGKAFAFAAPVLRALAKRELQTDMQALKLAVEHKLT